MGLTSSHLFGIEIKDMYVGLLQGLFPVLFLVLTYNI